MGLIDILNGMQNGPRGEPVPGKGGMSKITMALLGLLAYKAYKNFGSSQPADSPASRDPRSEREPPYADEPGGLAGVLRTIFGGGSVPAPVLRRGLDNTVRDMEDRGHGDIARSWVGRGANEPITPAKLEQALGEDAIRELVQQTGMERDELLEVLSEHLPRAVDHLTPDGRIPSEQEVARLV
jgi:uncharacterized protein YidB (DUF937 family)